MDVRKGGDTRSLGGFIHDLAGSSMLPWCILGDFNDMMFGWEKRGGRPHPVHLLEGFNNTITDCGLIDLGFTGNKITWEKSWGTDLWMQERLDRGLANYEWKNLFPSA